jgi:hypothetical protein
MRSTLRIGFVSVLTAATACAFVTAPASLTARAAVHHVTAVPDTGFTGDTLCDFEYENANGISLCMSGHDGLNGKITGEAHGDLQQLGIDEVVASNCGGKVQDGAQGQGAPCPFASGPGLNQLNKEFDGDSIVLLINDANQMMYATSSATPTYAGIIEQNAGSGELWVQVGDLLIPSTTGGAAFINVAASDANGGEPAAICADGNGQPLEAIFFPFGTTFPFTRQGSSCNWEDVGHTSE